MPVGIGSKSKLGFVVETVYGTFPTTPTGTQIGFTTESFQNSRNTFQSEEINPNRQVTAIRSGNVQAAGDLSTEFSPNALGQFIKHLLTCVPVTTTITPTVATTAMAVTRGTLYSASGARVYLCTRSGTLAAGAPGTLTSVDTNEEFQSGTAYLQYYGPVATAIYNHVMTGGVTKPTGGFSVEREVFLDGGSQFFRYTGGRINTWTLNVPQEGIVTCSFGFLFLDLDSVASTTIWGSLLTPTDDPFAGAEVVIQTKAPAGSYTDDFSLSNLTLSVTNNYDGNVFTVGQRRRRDLPEGRRVINGSFTAFFEDMTKFNFFKNESVISLLITANHNGMYASVELPFVKLTGGNPNPSISGNGVLSSTFNFEAFNNGGSHDIQVILKNSTTAYT